MTVTYLAGERAQGLAANSSDSWTSRHAEWTYDTSGYLNLSFIRRSTTVQAMHLDLQDFLGGSNLSDTSWVVRFGKFSVGALASSGNVLCYMGLSNNNDGESGGTQQTTVAGFNFSPSAGVINHIITTASLESGDSAGEVYNDLDANTDYYIEIKRDGNDFTVNAYSDEYSTLLGTEEITKTGLSSLRYLKLLNNSEQEQAGYTGASAKFHGPIQIYDGQTSATTLTKSITLASDKSGLTNVISGTRFEETDTKKIYRRVVGALANTTGLRFRYKFDEASGDVVNYGSVESADLTVSGLTRDVASPSGLGNGMSAPSNNSGDYAENQSRINDYKFMHDGSQWSVTFWMKATAMPGSSSWTETMIFGNTWTDDAGIGFHIRMAYGGSASTCRIQTFIANNTGTIPLNDQTGNDFVPDSDWHFYCLTYDPTLGSNHLTVTRDAVASGTSAQGFHQGPEDNDNYSSSNPTRRTVYFSRYTPTYDGGMAGAVAELTVWEDRILTQLEKVGLYNSGTGTTNIASAWKERGTA